MLDATEGPADGDPHQVQRPERPYLEEVSTPPGRLKIALQKRPLSHSGATVRPIAPGAILTEMTRIASSS